MKIVVIGGSGFIGSKLLNSLRTERKIRGNGHEALSASPSTGVDAVTGAGLARVLTGANVAVDVTNSPSLDGDAAFHFFQTAGRNLMTAEAAAGVGHHVALSIVGVERNSGVGYFRAKLAQERLVKASEIPYTIVRSTQFFEFIRYVVKGPTAGETIHASPALVQPVASEDVVAVLAGVARGAPANGVIEIAGPERLPLDEFVLRYLNRHHDLRPVISDIHARCFGLELNDKSLTPDDQPRIGPTRFEEWLSRTSAH